MQCSAITKSGKRCKNKAKENELCGVHVKKKKKKKKKKKAESSLAEALQAAVDSLPSLTVKKAMREAVQTARENGNKQYRTLMSVQGIGEVVREYRPARRTIVYKGRDKLIQTPYMIFALFGGSLYVAVAKAPIKSLDDRVYFCPFGNTWHESPRDYDGPAWGRVCGSHGLNIDAAVQMYWQTEFNADLSWGQKVRERTFGSYRYWGEISKRPNSEQEVLDLISIDGRSFSSFIGMFNVHWGKWQTHFGENAVSVDDARQRPRIRGAKNIIGIIPAHCRNCSVRFVCPGSVVPANWNVVKKVWQKTWGAWLWVWDRRPFRRHRGV